MFRRRGRRIALAGLGVFVVAFGGLELGTAPPPRERQSPRAQACTVVFDAARTERWAHVRGGWLAGDGVFSVALPGRRRLWLFGDSLVRTRAGEAPVFVRNAAVVERADGTLVTSRVSRGGRALLRLPHEHPGAWVWPATPFWSAGRLLVFASEIRTVPPGWWAYAYRRSWLFEVDPGSLSVRARVRLPQRPPGVIWGTAVAQSGGDLYVVGVAAEGKQPYLARAAPGSPARAWSFWDGRRWTRHPAAAVGWASPLGSQMSLIRSGRGWALVTKPASDVPGVRAYWAPALTGPWAALGEIYRPEAPPGFDAYNALVHPLDSKRLQLSYNVMAREQRAFRLDAAGMRPRFALVRQACLLPRHE